MLATNNQTLQKRSQLNGIRELLADDLAMVDQLITKELCSKVPLTQELTQYIFKSGGKRLRPLLVVLAANTFANQQTLNGAHHELAVIIEFVHTATLLHDDVVDNSHMRRGKKTANAIWSNQASVLVGDFLYSRAFQLLAKRKLPSVMAVLSEATAGIAEGEVLQLMNQYDANLSEENYYDVITQKTAMLFAAAAEIGAILGHAEEHRQAMSIYGLHLGIAFQVIDDLLDYQASPEATGKNLGDDLAEGKATLPLIIAMQRSKPNEAKYIKQSIKTGDLSALPNIISLLNDTDALNATKKAALRHAKIAKEAITNLPTSPYHEALLDLVQFSVQRCF